MNFNEQTIYTFRATKLLVDLMELVEVVSWKIFESRTVSKTFEQFDLVHLDKVGLKSIRLHKRWGTYADRRNLKQLVYTECHRSGHRGQ